MQTIILVVLTGLFYGIYNFFIKVSSGHINQIVGAVILQVVAALSGGLILLYLVLSKKTLEISATGVRFAVLAGVFVGLAEITSFIVFSKGLSASVGIPIIVGITVVAGAFLGVFFLKEPMAPIQYFGVVLAVLGIVLLSIQGR